MTLLTCNLIIALCTKAVIMALQNLMCAGACVIAREGGAPVTCAADGSFELLQCQPVGDLFQCQCVNPSDGGAIPSTEVVVANVDDAPDCDRLGEHLSCIRVGCMYSNMSD